MIKLLVKIGLVTSLLMVLYQASYSLLIYHYFKFEYYIAVVAVVALAIGVILTKKFQSMGSAKSAEKNFLSLLTNKEYQILTLISQGKSNKEIANLNFVEISTVKTHINNIYNKLGVSKRKNAVEIYQQYLSTQNQPFLHPL